MTTFAVVIPTRNDAPMLAICLEHLSAQSRPADEIIVVDNDSSDDTAAVCAAARVTRLEWPTVGVSGASAHGFDAARSEIIARVDADSRPAPDWLARIEEDLRGAGPNALVTGPGTFYGKSRLVHGLGHVIYLGGYFHVVGFLLGHSPVFGSNYAMTAEVWRRLGPLVARDRPEIHDDLDVSFLVRPDMSVFYDANLRMQVSARPFDSWATLGRRLRMSFETFRYEFRGENPLIRRRERRRWARTH